MPEQPDKSNQTDKQPGEGPDYIAPDSTPVCPNCLHPVPPNAYYCPNCGSNETINPLASYMPFVNIRFAAGMAAKAWRKATEDPQTSFPKRLAIIILLLIGYPIMVVLGLPYFITFPLKSEKARTVATFIIYAAIVLVFLLLVWQQLKTQ